MNTLRVVEHLFAELEAVLVFESKPDEHGVWPTDPYGSDASRVQAAKPLLRAVRRVLTEANAPTASSPVPHVGNLAERLVRVERGLCNYIHNDDRRCDDAPGHSGPHNGNLPR